MLAATTLACPRPVSDHDLCGVYVLIALMVGLIMGNRTGSKDPPN